MTPLREKMIDAMSLRGFSLRTHHAYLSWVSDLARYYHQSPDQLNEAQLQGYLLYLVKTRQLAPASCRQALNALRFLYLQVLAWPEFQVKLVTPKRPLRIPELLTPAEVARIIAACEGLRNRTMLTICYGCGLRVSELVTLKVRHVDGNPPRLRIEQAKGAKDRYVPLSQPLLAQLRRYWQHYRPNTWLFPSSLRNAALSVTTVQKIFITAKANAGIEKVGGIHSLRHAYATHQLAQGMSITTLQQRLGHRDIHSTLRYLHVVPDYHHCDHGGGDLIAQLEGLTHAQH